MPKIAFLGPQMVYLETLYLLTLFLSLKYLLLQIKFTLVPLWMEKNHLRKFYAIPFPTVISVPGFGNSFLCKFRRNLSRAFLWFFWPAYKASQVFDCLWCSHLGPLDPSWHFSGWGRGIFDLGHKASNDMHCKGSNMFYNLLLSTKCCFPLSVVSFWCVLKWLSQNLKGDFWSAFGLWQHFLIEIGSRRLAKSFSLTESSWK